MRNFKSICTLLALFLVIGTASAQSKGMDKKVDQKIAELNEELMALDASLALSEDQVKQLHETYATGMKAMNQARKSASTKEEGQEASKPIRKEMNKTIRKEILTKKQRKALNSNKKKK